MQQKTNCAFKIKHFFLCLILITLISCNNQTNAPEITTLPVEDDNQKSQIYIWYPQKGIISSFQSDKNTPVELMMEAEIDIHPDDKLWWNGQSVSFDTKLPQSQSYFLQIQPAVTFTVKDKENISTIQSSAPTIGKALWQAGIGLNPADQLSVPIDKPLTEDLSIVLNRSIPVNIYVDGKNIQSRTATATVGQALAEIGVSLQNLDYSIPAEDQPLPQEGSIQVIRVHEELVLKKETLPYETERRPDPEKETGEQWVIEEGQTGTQFTRIKTRFENDQEISSDIVDQWIASYPKTHVIGYGTKVVVASIDDIDYWIAKPMYATSYYPCGFVNRCSYTTANGSTLEKGIVALTVEWYKVLKGSRVYIPGYGIGVVADTGYGIPGKDWIDLGYGNDDYVPWSKEVMVYFLPPAPDTIPWFLQE